MRLFNHCSVPLLTVPLLCLPSFAGPTPAKKPIKKNSSPPIRIGIVERGFKATIPDQKRPGKLLCYVEAASAEGQSADTGFLGKMTQVLAKLYQQGQPSATLTAPRADGSGTPKALVITCTGGVVVHSLTQLGTVLTADTVVWYSKSNQIVATGHVVYHDSKTGVTASMPRFVADTQLKTFHSEGPGHASGRF
jgi:hypothetical protein